MEQRIKLCIFKEVTLILKNMNHVFLASTFTLIKKHVDSKGIKQLLTTCPLIFVVCTRLDCDSVPVYHGAE